MLFNSARLADIIVGTKQEGLYPAPSSLDLSTAAMLMASATGRERRFKRAVAPVAEQFDSILIETPPNLGIITIHAFNACTGVLIPIALTTSALIGITI